MKKLILSSVLLSTVLLSGSVVSNAAYNKDGVTSADTDVNITVRPNTGSEETGGQYKDKLSIVHVPTAFEFAGTATNSQLILDNENTKKDAQFISVYDDRPAKEDGTATAGKWTLAGKLGTIQRVDANGDKIASTDNDVTILNGKLVSQAETAYPYAIGNTEVNVPGAVSPDPLKDYKPDGLNTADGKNPLTGTAANVVVGDGAKNPMEFVADATAETPIMTSKAAAKNGAFTNLGNAKFVISAGSATNGTDADFHYKGKLTYTLTAQP